MPSTSTEVFGDIVPDHQLCISLEVLRASIDVTHSMRPSKDLDTHKSIELAAGDNEGSKRLWQASLTTPYPIQLFSSSIVP